MKRSWAGYLISLLAGGELYTEFQVVLASWIAPRETNFARA